MKPRIHLWTVVVLIILNYASSQQISNCCWTEISRKGCDNATILDAIVALPDMNGCKNGWADYCAETVYREFDHCVPDCGDGICAVKSGESCETCPQDCGYCDASKSCANIDETLFSPDDNNTIFEDPFFADQWHIHNTGQQQFSFVATPGNDINVLPVYKQYRIFGKGITVGIVDDGVEWRHPDLQCGYKPELSADIDLDIKFQQPAVFDAHGTCCAGVCCGQGNNTACGIGVAFKANNAGIRVLGNAFSDAKCAEALAYEHTKIDIYSNSWGPADDGATIERYPLALNAISKGIKEGRNGRGAIYVWAAGNGYLRGDGANFDELANSPYTICVGASDWNGKFSTYSEPGANVLCNAPSSTRGYDTQASTWRYYSTMMTADRMGFPGYNRAARSEGNCAIDFGGTSAACPLAAGVLALILEANPRLTWRDMQWIIVKTSTKTDTRHASWKRNAAGYYFSKHYGYGRLDAYKAVTAAKSWTNVCDKYSTYTRKVGLNLGETSLPLSGVEIPKNNTYPLILYASFEDIPDMTVESVSVVISANAKRRGQLVFAVGSAQGTISMLSEGRNNDFGSDYHQQIFTTVQLWGESGKGVWGFSIYDNNRDLAQAAIQSTLTEVQLIIHGSTVDCTSEEIVVTTVGPTKKPVQPTPSSSRDWLPFRVRTIITVVLFSSVSLIVVVVVLVWVFKMQKSAETELNSDIWKEMIEDETTEKKTDQEEESIQEEA